MGQLFKRRANAIAKLAVAGVPLLVAGLSGAMFMFARSDFWTGVAVPIEQPVPFSHKHHVADDGIDCRYCHTSVENSAFAGIPPTEICMTCHSQLFKDAPVLEPVRASAASGRPIKWQRVYDLPDYVYFDHSIHVDKGIGCQTCHGQVNEMALTWKTQELQMRWCLGCHRDPAKFIRPKKEVFDMAYAAPKDQRSLGQQLLATNHVQTAGLTDCYTCHR
jgi:cytochrome c7-like protein